MSKQAKGEPRTSSVVVENTLQKVSMEMSKLVEDLEDNVNILNGQKQQANATNNNNNAANANKKPNATISNKNKNSANNKKAGSASSNNTSNAPQNRNRVLANRNKKNSYSSNRFPVLDLPTLSAIKHSRPFGTNLPEELTKMKILDSVNKNLLKLAKTVKYTPAGQNYLTEQERLRMLAVGRMNTKKEEKKKIEKLKAIAPFKLGLNKLTVNKNERDATNSNCCTRNLNVMKKGFGRSVSEDKNKICLKVINGKEDEGENKTQNLAAIKNSILAGNKNVSKIENVTEDKIANNSKVDIEKILEKATVSLLKDITTTTNKSSKKFHLNPEQENLLQQIKNDVEECKKSGKTFTVISNYYSVRNALSSRGWIEKVYLILQLPNYITLKFLGAKSIEEIVPYLTEPHYSKDAKTMIQSKLLEGHQVDFYWGVTHSVFDVCPDKVKYTLINTIKRKAYSYSSKLALADSAKISHWLNRPDCSLKQPRTYNLTNNGDPSTFIKDFKISAVFSFLKWVLYVRENKKSLGETNEEEEKGKEKTKEEKREEEKTKEGKTEEEMGESDGTPKNPHFILPTGIVPYEILTFALDQCKNYLRAQKHADIDCEIQEATDEDWQGFFAGFHQCVHKGQVLKNPNFDFDEDEIVAKCFGFLQEVEKFWPDLPSDGFMNIWILKPVYSSMGKGIHVCQSLKYVLNVLSNNKEKVYIIQKYIERPLLIYNTKFDIRQWFLISSTVPLTIWMYKVCYLRFSSQTYNLRKLHESIHLTNNSVQTRYKNCNRDPNLPQHNMWDSVEFQKYLENSGYPNAWKNIIYPGMRQCFVAAVLLNQEYICARKNSFELYGADFMITEDFKPWLIEINSRPALHPSTPVTARLCPQVLEDVIKVVIDNARDPNAKTGQFEQIYKQKIPPLPKCNVDELKLEGTPLPSSYFCKPEEVKDLEPKINPSSGLIDINNTNSYMKYVRNEMRKTLEKLLTIIRTERSRRKKLKNLNSNASNTKAIKQQEIDKCNKNIDKGVECVLEIKDLMKHQEKSKDQLVGTDNVEKSNSSIQVDLIKELIGEDGSQEAEAIKDTLLKITETSDSTSSTAIFNDVLKLLSGLKKEEN